MKYALVNNIKTEAQKGLKGYCPNCSLELTAKCGDYKVHHWSHKKTINCDPWWETETEWHRNWKNHYPADWQEFSFEDPKTNEKHIADIQTVHNLVIEFQHSNIDPKERINRELFYKNMIWVVDGTRLKRDCSRFLKSFKNFKKTEKKGLFFVDYIDEVFPKNWLNSSVPVLFDFKGIEDLIDNTDIRHNLYCLFQVRVGRYSLVAEIPRKAFIGTTINGEWITRSKSFIESLIPPKNQPIQNQKIKTKPKHREGTHYYDQKKGKLVKKWRF
jgi:hypothetical protein